LFVGGEFEGEKVSGAYIGTFLVANGNLRLEAGGTLLGAGYARSVMVQENGLIQPEPALDLLVAAAAGWTGMESCYVESKDESDSSSDSKSNNESSSKSSKKSKSKS